jgi:hypothetical protein
VAPTSRFAHRPDAEVTEKDAREIETCLAGSQQKMLQEFTVEQLAGHRVVGAIALILHTQLWMAIRHLRDDRISYDYSAKRLRDGLDHVPRKTGVSPDDELADIHRQLHADREARGEP